MKYLEYAVAAVVGFLAGWISKGLIRPRPQNWKIRVALEKVGGQWTKTIYANQLEAHPGDTIDWIITTNEGVKVAIVNFRDQDTGKAKKLLKGNPKDYIPSPKGTLTGEVRDKEIFDELPNGHQDSHGRYQDFIYGFEVDGDPIDPEIRIREY